MKVKVTAVYVWWNDRTTEAFIDGIRLIKTNIGKLRHNNLPALTL